MTSHLQPDDPRPDFVAVESYCRGMGFDVGPGTNKFSPTVLCTDWYPHKGVDLVWNCLPTPEQGQPQYFYPYPFTGETFDFIFASHVLEDFEPGYIQIMFDELLRMIKPGGNFVVLGPCMDGVRYAKWDEVFTADHPSVISGKRQVGELIGNPSHRVNWDLELCHSLRNESKYPTEILQEDTFPTNQMTIDFVLKKL